LKARNKFDEVFAEAVYEGLSWFSSLIAPLILIQDAMSFESGMIKSKLKIRDAIALERGLERVFGFGAKVLEKKILEVLYIKLQLNREITQNFKFAQEVEKASKLYKSKLRARERS